MSSVSDEELGGRVFAMEEMQQSRRIGTTAFRRPPAVGMVLGAGLAWALLGQPAVEVRAVVAAPPSRPTNVLLILIDDLRPLLGCYGDELAQTPNIDRLARRGVRFDLAYSTYPICGPSRASILSGRRPLTTDYYGWEYVPNVAQMPGWFRQHGYRTAEFGKVYHMNRLAAPKLGETRQNVIGVTVNPPGSWDLSDACVTPEDPDGYGYSYSATLREEDPALTRFVVARGDVSPPQLPGAWNWQEWVELDMPDERTSDGMVVRRAAATITQAADEGRPFFVAAGLYRPHLTLAAPKLYFDQFRDVAMPQPPSEPRDHLLRVPEYALTYPKGLAYQIYSDENRMEFERAYRANIAFVDAQVGVLLDTLDERKLWDNTIVVLTSDHGYHMGEHGGLTQKHTLFEEATRVPLIVAAPNGRANGSGCDNPVELVDIFPTLTDLCGLSAPDGLDGMSLSPLLVDAKSRLDRPGAISVVRRRALAQGPEYDAELRLWGEGTEGAGSSRFILGISLRTGDWRYTEWDGGKLGAELYDERVDPREMNNLANDPAYAARRETMRKLLAQTIGSKAAN